MSFLPPLPNWQELHPLVVHLPVALLLVAPLFVLLGTVFRTERTRMFLISALIVMVLGTASLYWCTHTGRAASERQMPAPATAVLLEHRALAFETRTIFTAVTAIFGLLLLLTLHFQLRLGELAPVLPIAFLAFYCVGVILLVSTIFRGGQLVHQFGL